MRSGDSDVSQILFRTPPLKEPYAVKKEIFFEREKTEKEN